MKNLIVKVGRDALVEGVRSVVKEDGFVTYYRESPDGDGTEAAFETFKAIVELKPKIKLGTQAPSEWGRLEWVEAEASPAVARFFMARGQKFLISRPPKPTDLKPAVVVGGPMAPDVEDGAFQQIDLLLRSDRVLESQMDHPELAMADTNQKAPALHIRVAYDSRRWASRYPMSDVPDNVRSFMADLWRFADRMIGDRSEGTVLTDDQARSFFKDPHRR